MPPQNRRPAVFLQLSHGRLPYRRVAQVRYGVNAHILDKQPRITRRASAKLNYDYSNCNPGILPQG